MSYENYPRDYFIPYYYLYPYRQYPAVDPQILYDSATETNKLMSEASLVLDRLSTSKEFGSQVMHAAQTSNNEEVERLIHSLGITSDLDIHYNPDGLRLTFESQVENTDCCILKVSLRWR